MQSANTGLKQSSRHSARVAVSTDRPHQDGEKPRVKQDTCCRCVMMKKYSDFVMFKDHLSPCVWWNIT